MWGVRAFCLSCAEGCRALAGNSFYSKMAAIVPARTSGYIWPHAITQDGGRKYIYLIRRFVV